MRARINVLVRAELCNIYGWNVFRSSRDKKVKKRAWSMLAVWAVLLGLLVFYMGGLSYSLLFLGMGDVVPAYLTVIASLLVFFFGILKAGSVIFRREGYDILCALPVSKTAIVASRFVRMYVEDLLMVLVVLLPGIIVYVWEVRPGLGSYLAVVPWAVSVPFIPMAGAIMIGTLITGISSRMRYKSVVAAGLSVLAVLGVVYLSSRIAAMGDGSGEDLLRELSVHTSALLEKLYPPAVWVSAAVVKGQLWKSILWAGCSLAVFAAVAAVVSRCFHWICQNLYTSPAEHSYEVERLEQSPVLAALCRREFRRYLASSVYVSNTIIGPVMGCVMAGGLLAVGAETITENPLLPVDVEGAIPFLLAGMFCMMTPAATSISMEGKDIWILKSLPLTTKAVLDAKILMNLLLFLPFYILAEILLFLALRPGGLGGVWLVLIPAAIILFSCVYGITIDLHFPVLDWEDEVRVVKQSASALLGGMGGFLLAFLCVVGAIWIPAEYRDIYSGCVCAVILLTAGILYRYII